MSLFCVSHLGDGDVELLQEYVSNTIGYHPGLVFCFLGKIRNPFSSDVKYDKQLTFEKIFTYIKSYDCCVLIDEGAGVCKALHHLTLEGAELCDAVFSRPIHIRLNFREGCLRQAYSADKMEELVFLHQKLHTCSSDGVGECSH